MSRQGGQPNTLYTIGMVVAILGLIFFVLRVVAPEVARQMERRAAPTNGIFVAANPDAFFAAAQSFASFGRTPEVTALNDPVGR